MENPSELSDVQMDSCGLDDVELTSGDSQTESKRDEEVEEVKEEKKELGKREINSIVKKFEQIPFTDPLHEKLKKKYVKFKL